MCFMLGAFAGVLSRAGACSTVCPLPSVSGRVVVVLISAASSARCIGILIEFLAYRPLRNRPKLTVLITAIGVSLFIEFTCQHEAVFGARHQAVPEAAADAGLSPRRPDRSAATTSSCSVSPRVLLAALWFIVQRTQDRHGDARGVLQPAGRGADGREHQPHHLLHLRPRLRAGRGRAASSTRMTCAGHRAAHGRAAGPAGLRRRGARWHRQSPRRGARRHCCSAWWRPSPAACPGSRTTATASPSPSSSSSCSSNPPACSASATVEKV